MYNLAIIYGEEVGGVQKKAVEVLSEILLDYTYEYPICFQYDAERDFSQYRCIYIGTKENNDYIKAHSTASLSKREEYFINVENDTVVIEGYDDNGVLYGCVDFYNKYLLKDEYLPSPESGWKPGRPMDKPFEDFKFQSAPAIKDRGIWTWGHVIYDYRGFLDNMVKLKMNTLIMWNDHVPFHAKEIIEYAHACGIKILFGFPWCWDTDCGKFDLATINKQGPVILEQYEKEYAGLNHDGIYFQSFTELPGEEINGILIAEAVTNFVNKTAELFFEKYPNLELQFGLHATSVREKLDYIKNVNPKITIVWEDCGAFPFSYSPHDIETYGETNELAKKVTNLRGKDDKFAVVTKGFTCLDWSAFEHLDGPVNFGVSSKTMKQNRITRKHKKWKYLQAYWLQNADKAYETVKLMCDAKSGNLGVTPLIEDGMFEENIMFHVALFAEMLWDCDGELGEMMTDVALRDYVEFA